MIIRNRTQFNEFLRRLSRQVEVVVDCETTGLDVWQGDVACGYGFSFKNGDTFYMPFRHKRFDESMSLFAILNEEMEDENLPLTWIPEIWQRLRGVKTLIGHNIKFDLTAMTTDGYEVPDGQLIEDTKCGARLYFKDKYDELSLENLVHHLIGPEIAAWKARFTAYLEQRGIKDHYDQAEVDVLGEYCERDCGYTFEARQKLLAFAEKTGQSEVYDTEREAVTTLWHMERAGLALDLNYITSAIEACREAQDKLMGEIVNDCNMRINPWSAPDITRAMATHKQKPTHVTEKKQEPSWADDVLQKLVKKGNKSAGLAKLILNWRSIDKMVSTFFEPYLKNPSGWVHPTFNSSGPITGRLSCEKPNLQQVSKPEDWDIECLPDFDIQVRRMFIPPPGYKLLSVDYVQMEMIGFADYLNDQKLTAELNKGGIDYHELAAKLISDMTGIDLVRKEAKAVSLGLIYGMGKEKLAKRLEKSEEEAYAIKRAFFKAFPTAEVFIRKVHETAKLRGYVFNRFGRRYWIHEDHVYAAVNYLVQGTCADIVKRAMVRLHKKFRENKWKTRLAAQMHDEFLFYVHESEWEEAIREIIRIMEDVPIMKTKLFVDVSVGNPSWADKLSVCKICTHVKEEGHECKLRRVDDNGVEHRRAA